jgi:3-oxoacyl-[acyl-carrier-protein] synthase-3
VRVVVDSAEKALAAAGVSTDQLSLVVPHQANIRIIQAACQRLNVEMDRAVVVLDRYGNTSSASIPLAVVDARADDRLHKGDYALLTGFGAGMTWASAVVRWSR